MIHRDKILEQLEGKREKFIAFESLYQNEAGKYLEALERMSMLPAIELENTLKSIETPGALPTVEFDSARNLRIEFPHKWNNHQEAREWAFETLLDHPTFGVDGSQIRPYEGFSIPVAAVQIAWFENPHTGDGRYTKDVRFEVITPDELSIESNGDRVNSEQRVHMRRFELEIEALCEIMERLARSDDSTSKLPVGLFDSSLVISFADRLQGEMQERHIRAMLKLLRSSEKTRVPVVGYIDGSRSRDLLNMIAVCFNLPDAENFHDTGLVGSRMIWGERTPMFICARGGADRKQQGILEKFEEYSRGIGFIYLKTSATSPPARLELPRWVLDRGMLDKVINLIIAEVVVGNGYPYVIQSADAAAVISLRDRDDFHAIFQRFATERQIDLRISQKATSKPRRR